jgi:hypothetical protein
LANFLSISPTQTKFLSSVCLVPEVFSAYILLDFKVAKWAVSSLTHSSNPFQVNVANNSKCIGSEKTSEKKRHQIFKLPNLCGNQLISTYVAAFVFVPSCL